MKEQTLYIALEQSILVDNPYITIGDIATIYCKDKAIDKKVRELGVTCLPETTKSQLVVTAMKLIQLIEQNTQGITIEAIGNPETIVYYDSGRKKGSYKQKLKVVFLMLVAFFGTAFSIMSYNQDSGTRGLLDSLYQLFTGDSPEMLTPGLAIGLISYCVGLTIGMIVFFNHGVNTKVADDPSPLQVQMRLYEQEVNQCIVIDSTRKQKTLDVD